MEKLGLSTHLYEENQPLLVKLLKSDSHSKINGHRCSFDDDRCSLEREGVSCESEGVSCESEGVS